MLSLARPSFGQALAGYVPQCYIRRMSGKGTRPMKHPLGVPLELIKNANPVYVRDEFVRRDVAELARDILDRGLQQPILTDHLYRVIDGGRRLAAFEKLGYTEIPTLATDHWATIRDRMVAHLKSDEASGASRKPMTWREVGRLQTILHELYETARHSRQDGMGASRRITGSGYSTLNLDIAEMLGLRVPHLMAIIALRGQLDLVALERPEFTPKAETFVKDIEGLGDGQLHGAIRQVSALRSAKPDIEPNLKHAQEQLKILRSGLQMMHTIANQLSDLGELNPAMLPGEVREVHNALLTMARHLSPVRVRLSNRFDADQLHAREEENK